MLFIEAIFIENLRPFFATFLLKTLYLYDFLWAHKLTIKHHIATYSEELSAAF